LRDVSDYETCVRLRARPDNTVGGFVPDDGMAEVSGLDLDSLSWRRPAGAEAGDGPGVMEVAMAPRSGGGSWVLLRVTGDPDGRVLVYDEHEWECFLAGVRNGEFDLTR
jgi:hypothetical protein